MGGIAIIVILSAILYAALKSSGYSLSDLVFANNPEALKKSRERQESKINLSIRLHKFLGSGDYIHNSDSNFSKVSVETSPLDGKSVREFESIRYAFKAEDRLYTAIWYKWKLLYSGFDNSRHYNEFIEILCDPSERVFRTKLEFTENEYIDSYSGRKLEAFIPGPWIKEITAIITLWEKDLADKIEYSKKEQKFKDDQMILQNFRSK